MVPEWGVVYSGLNIKFLNNVFMLRIQVDQLIIATEVHVLYVPPRRHGHPSQAEVTFHPALNPLSKPALSGNNCLELRIQSKCEKCL